MNNEFMIVFGGPQPTIINLIVFCLFTMLSNTTQYEANLTLFNIYFYEEKEQKMFFNLINHCFLILSSHVRDHKDLTW